MKLRRPILTVVVVATLFLVAVIAIRKISLSSANTDRLRAIAARGEPTSVAELNTFYSAVPDQSNAALLWLKGSSALSDDLDSALNIFHQAARLDQSRFPVTLSPEAFTNLQYLAAMKRAAQVLRDEARRAIDTTNTALASQAISGIFAAGHSIAHEPLVISQLVGYAIDAIGVETLEFALNAAQFNESELVAMQAAVSKADDPERAARGFIGERAFFISGLKDPAKSMAAARGTPPSGIEEIVQEAFVFPLTRLTGFWQRDLRFGIDALTTNIAFARLPDPQRVQSVTNSSALIAQAKSRYYIMSGLLLPALEKYLLRDANHRASVRTALVGIAVERFRLAHDGTAPGDLSSLVPIYLDRVPADPYDGLPLRYKLLDRGYVVYSIGPDSKDDGGVEPPRGPKPKALWDVTFVVEKPESR